MSRIQSTFEELAKTNRKALVAYVTAGDPHPDNTVQIMHTLVEAGANIIELGVPFSDPMADGPVIQAACERALVHDTSLKNVLAMVTEFRKQDSQTPVVLMGYQNPIEVMGAENFAQQAKQSQVDGVLTVDVPIEQADETLGKYKEYDLDNIFLIAPTTSTHGIKDAESAAKVAEIADAVVVGSAIIREIEQHAADQQTMLDNIKSLLSGMRQAMDHATTNKRVA